MALRSSNALQRDSAVDGVRDRLIKVSGEVFAERGYEAATVREICSRAGANVAALNYYFRDKLGLYTEVLRLSAPDPDLVYSVFESNAPKEEVLRGVIRAMLEKMFNQKQPDIHFRIMAFEMARPTPAVERVIDEVVRPVYDRLRKLIGEIGGLPPDHEKTRLCTHSVIGQLMHYVHGRSVIRHLWPGMRMEATQLDRIADHIADLLLVYLGRETRTSEAGKQLKVVAARKGSRAEVLRGSGRKKKNR